MNALCFVTLILFLFIPLPSAVAEDSWFAKDGVVDIVSSSHQDTAWMDSPAACRKFRIEHNLMTALEMMRKLPDYTFCMECSLHLMELLEAHPEVRAEVVQRMKEGRLEFGATYNQPYEAWLSGEDLIRQTYYGRRWIMKNLPGCDAKVAFNPDPPARTLQMQQILAKSGVPYMFISRYHEGLYRWGSPDGSSILAYTPGHYYNHQAYLSANPATCVTKIQQKLIQQTPYYQQHNLPPAYCLINTQDFSRPVDFNPLINAWKASTAAPTMRYSSIRGFFESIDQPTARIAPLTGERPDVWLYITGPTHHTLDTAKRRAARLLPAAETFATFAALLDSGMAKWPAKQLEQAWLDGLYVDHGIGGKNGHITDEVFLKKVADSGNAAENVLSDACSKISKRIMLTIPDGGKGITVFNTQSWQRSMPVEVRADASCHIINARGKEIPSQLTTVEAEKNVALGATATASSAFGPDYAADRAIDGKWNVCDTNPETGKSTKWNSASVNGPHDLTLDFHQPRTLHKIVIRHEGVVGQFSSETKFNTVDYQLQSAPSPDGPWTDLVPPVTGNDLALTVHEFAPVPVRCLRLHITKGARADGTARIQELEAFEKAMPAQNLVFVPEVPSLGFDTYYIVPGAPAAATPLPLENDHYRITLAPGGIKGIFDKAQNRELLDTANLLGGEVFTMLSTAPNKRGLGTDAGEFGTVPMPVMDETYDHVAAHRPVWKLIENGPVRSVHQLEQKLVDVTVRQRVILWHGHKRIDCEVDLLGFTGRHWREFRMALPLAMEKPQFAYDVPMGVVEIGKDEIPTTGGFAYGNLTYADPCREIHPRLLQNFVDASDATGGLTLTSSVSAFDWIDPTVKQPGKPVLQPVLLASRKSCNGEGNWYPQAGDHHYQFTITTHAGGWRNNWRDGISANHPAFITEASQPNPDASLPPTMGFASTNAPNVLISTIKKAEDDDSIIARVWDIEGKDSQVTLDLFYPIRDARHTNLIEEPGKPLDAAAGKVTLPVGHHAIETIKLQP